MPRLPPVENAPHGRLRATLCPGVGYSVVTFDQSHSNSSATNWARPVSVPWPISERAMRMTVVLSGLMTTQTPTSGEPSAARTTLGPNGRSIPNARPPPTAAVPMKKERRFILGTKFMMMPSLYAFAAEWIAARTCWKVPHRQMLVISLSMSASVGFGLSLSSSVTAMIRPLWQ